MADFGGSPKSPPPICTLWEIFMKSRIASAGLTLLVISATTPALAQMNHRNVPPNRSTIVGFFRVLTNDRGTCVQPAKPTMLLVTPPQHGTVKFHWARHEWKKMRAACKGVGIGGMEIIYTPTNGYHGPDAFKIGGQYAQYAIGGGSSYSSGSYEIRVR